jgi:hypothetical protein
LQYKTYRKRYELTLSLNKYINAFMGTIHAEVKEGEGAEFIIHLPIV